MKVYAEEVNGEWTVVLEDGQGREMWRAMVVDDPERESKEFCSMLRQVVRVAQWEDLRFLSEASGQPRRDGSKV